jgi:GDPmannose 4,6-dehydratase
MPTALITGITGQDGLYLAELLLTKGYDVHGVIRGQNNPKRDLVHELLPDVSLHNGDLTDMSSLVRALRDSDPEEVYNLGAVSFVAYSWENAHLTTDVTAKGVLNLLEAIRLHTGDDPTGVRFYQASSSEMFGKVQESPQHERTLLWPRSPYGVSKVFGHHMTINYRESYGMHASSGILFNHESPRRGQEFVTRKISRWATTTWWPRARRTRSATSSISPSPTSGSRTGRATCARTSGSCGRPTSTSSSVTPARPARYSDGGHASLFPSSWR